MRRRFVQVALALAVGLWVGFWYGRIYEFDYLTKPEIPVKREGVLRSPCYDFHPVLIAPGDSMWIDNDCGGMRVVRKRP